MITISEGKLVDSQLLSLIHTQAFKNLQKPWTADVIYHTILNKNNHTIIAYDENNQPLGFIIYSLIPQMESEILTICTIQTRSGIATSLINHMISHSKSAHIERILLDVAADNIPAISLYKKLGFQTISTRKNYYKRTPNISVNANLMIVKLE